MKKIISCILMLGLSFQGMVSVFADDTYSQYITRIENAIESMDDQELSEFQGKIADAIRSSEQESVKEFLRNILLLTAQSDAETAMEAFPVESVVELEEVKIEPEYLQLTESEIRTVNYEITKLQGSLEDETLSLLSQMVTSWNNISRYTEKGNMTAEMDLEIDRFVSANAGMNISEYIAQNQVFDSSISADISGFYNIDTIFDSVEIDGKANIDFVQKGQESYLLVRDSEINTGDEALEIELTPMMEKLKELASNNTYISYGEESAFNPLALQEYFTQKNIESEIKMLFTENLMEAYGKNQNGYLLRPTKHFCDSGKSLMSVFDPFNGDECSEKQYQNMLDDFTDSKVEITLQTGNDVTLSIVSGQDEYSFETVYIDLVWKNASFDEFNMSVVDNYDSTLYLEAHYKANDTITVYMPEQPYDPEFILDVDLGYNGKIKTIDLLASYEDEVEFVASYDKGFVRTSLEINTPEIKANCSLTGDAYASYLKADSSCEISSPMIETRDQSLSIESAILYNGRSGLNNLSWTFEAISDENNYLNFDIQSNAKRTSAGSFEIQTPTNTIDYFDFLKEVSPENSYYYDDYESDYEYEYNSYDEYDEACYIYNNGNRTCYEYYDNKDITCTYIAESDEETCETYEYDSVYEYDGYTYEYNEYDDYDETCYIYDSGDTTCYKYYSDKDITCNYVAESNEETCETYEYGYSVEETTYDDYDEVCYSYDNGDTTCYQYYDDKDITCDYYSATDEENCYTYEYNNYDDYYDYKAEDAMEQ